MFLLDANVFIDASNKYYGIDFVPGFWSWLREKYESDVIRSITAVRGELLRQDDALAEWAGTLPHEFWISEDSSDIPSLGRVAEWAMASDSQYTDEAKSGFLDAADYRLVAVAHSRNLAIVTHESAAPDSKKRIKMPDASREFGVSCIPPFEFFKNQGLHLSQHRV